MGRELNFKLQFSTSYEDFLKKLDFFNWYRYYFIIQSVMNLKPKNVLEIGAGNEVVKDSLRKFVGNYQVMDINPKLNPNILSDLREFKPELKENFDCVICADVLEHMPFEELEKNLTNIYSYLIRNGKAIITIPHRRSRVMIVTPLSYFNPLIFTLPFWLKSSLKSFYQQVIKKEVWIDSHHYWEISDGKVKKKDVE